MPDAAAARTRLRNLKEPSRADYLTAAATSWTINRPGSRLGAASAAFAARVQLAHLDFFFGAKRCFLERNLHVITKIRAALSLFRGNTTTTKKRLENSAAAAELLAKDIKRVVEMSPKCRALTEGR